MYQYFLVDKLVSKCVIILINFILYLNLIVI